MRRCTKNWIKTALLLAILTQQGFAADKAQITKEIRAIMSKAPKGKSYEKEFKEILAIGPSAVPSLIDIFKDGRVDWNDRWIAGMALGRHRTPESRKALEKGLKDSFPTIRMGAAKALGYMGDLSAAPTLRKALSDEAMVVRSSVALALGQLKDTNSIDQLSDELMAKRNFNQGKSFWVREDILDALGMIADERALPALQEAIKEKEKNIVLKACAALTKVTPKGAKSVSHPTGPKCAAAWQAWFNK